MLKSLFNLFWHFVYHRPDKILATIALPFLIIILGNYHDNIREYKNFIWDK